MKIHIDDIPESGFQLNVESKDAKWLSDILNDVLEKENFEKDDDARLNLQLFRQNQNVTIIGGLILKFHPSCSRCLTRFSKQQQIPIHQILSPKKTDSSVDDEDISYYIGDEIDMGNITREQLLLAQQMVNLCNEGCKGLCQSCGKNLNTGPCKCKKKRKLDSPFAILKGKKLDKNG